MPSPSRTRIEIAPPRVWRREAFCWVGSVAIHVPLFLWQGASPPPPPPLSHAVEITLASDASERIETSEAPPGPESSAAAPPSRAKVAAPTRRIRRKRSNPWAGFQSSGPWGKSTGPSSAKVAGRLRGKGGFGNIPSTWLAKGGGSGKAPVLAAGGAGDGPAPDPADQGGSMGGSMGGGGTWTPSGGGGEEGGGLAGADPSDKGGSLEGGVSSAWQAGGGAGQGDLKESGVGGMGGGGGAGGGLYELRGPMARRRVLSASIPRYPDWALEQGIEADVTVYFVVSPEGIVKEPVLVRKTSGETRLDQLVVQNLLRWKFSPLRGGKRGGEQWGLLTFHFRLR